MLLALVGLVTNGKLIIDNVKSADTRKALFEGIKSDCKEVTDTFKSEVQSATTTETTKVTEENPSSTEE